MHKIASLLVVLLTLVSATPVRATADVYVIGWVYASGREVPPEQVTIAITGGTEAWRDIGPRGGTIALRTPGGRACYQVTIHAPPLVFTRLETSECQPQVAPSLIGQWQPAGYAVSWQAGEPVCVFIAGHLYPVTCAASGSTVIPRAGDAAYVAATGRVVELRTAWGLAPVAQMVIPPEHAAWLPLVAGP